MATFLRGKGENKAAAKEYAKLLPVLKMNEDKQTELMLMRCLCAVISSSNRKNNLDTFTELADRFDLIRDENETE